MLSIKASCSPQTNFFEASAPSFAFSYTISSTISSLRWSHFRHLRFSVVFFPPCAGRISDIFDSPPPFLPSCAGRIANISDSSTAVFPLALVALQTDPALHCLLSFLRWPCFGLGTEIFNSTACLLLYRTMPSLPAFI